MQFNIFFRLITFTLLAGVTMTGCRRESVSDKQLPPDPATEMKLAVGAVSDSLTKLREKGKLVQERDIPKKFKSAEQAIEYMKGSGDWDKYSVGVIPGIAKDEISYADKLLHSTFPYFVIADKGTMRVTLYDRFGRAQMSFPMACSRYYGTKHKFRDNRTPEGYFTAEGIYDSREWLYTDDDGNTSQAKGVYGPRFMRLLTPVTRSVGIHGTNSPSSPGLRCSHGCMRLLNKNVWELVKYAQKGMPIIVNPSAKDDAVNRKEECRIPMLSLGRPMVTLLPEPEEINTKKEEEKTVEPPADKLDKPDADEGKTIKDKPVEPTASSALAEPATPSVSPVHSEPD